MESNSTADANYCQLAIWNADGTAKTTQDKTDGNILHPAMPLDPAEAHQYAVYCSLKTLTEEEKAQYPGLVLNVFDLYDENGTARLPMTSLVLPVLCGYLFIRLFLNSICRVISLSADDDSEKTVDVMIMRYGGSLPDCC